LDWQAGVKFVRPDFLDNYPGAAGYWEIQDFTFEEITEVVTAAGTAVWAGVSGTGKPADNATVGADWNANVENKPTTLAALDSAANTALNNKLANGVSNVMASNFFLQTNGYAGGNGVALYDGGLIAKSGGVDKLAIGSDGNATFAGTLNVASATSGARTEITNAVIRVYDSGNTIRVKLGNLS
jgi:hypothetical protein